MRWDVLWHSDRHRSVDEVGTAHDEGARHGPDDATHSAGGRVGRRGGGRLTERLRIEQQDERNRTIADRAKARAYDASLYIFSALMLCFTLMRVDLAVILLLVGAYLLVVGINIYYHVKYNREL